MRGRATTPSMTLEVSIPPRMFSATLEPHFSDSVEGYSYFSRVFKAQHFRSTCSPQTHVPPRRKDKPLWRRHRSLDTFSPVARGPFWRGGGAASPLDPVPLGRVRRAPILDLLRFFPPHYLDFAGGIEKRMGRFACECPSPGVDEVMHRQTRRREERLKSLLLQYQVAAAAGSNCYISV